MRPNTLTHKKHSTKKHSLQKPRFLARCSQPLSNTQTPHPTTKAGRQPAPRVVSKPNSVPDDLFANHKPRRAGMFVVHPTRRHYSGRIPHGSHPTQRGMSLVVLLRKEVIQPHLPVRLPCYDFVPIADPTFDHSLPRQGLGHGLRVLPTFMT